jgi:hypothetical protein
LDLLLGQLLLCVHHSTPESELEFQQISMLRRFRFRSVSDCSQSSFVRANSRGFDPEQPIGLGRGCAARPMNSDKIGSFPARRRTSAGRIEPQPKCPADLVSSLGSAGFATIYEHMLVASVAAQKFSSLVRRVGIGESAAK